PETLEHVEAVLTVLGLDHVEAGQLEVGPDEKPDRRRVVDDQHGGGHEVHATGALPLVGATSTRRSGPRSSGDRAPPSGGGSAGSNPAGGATGDDTPSALLQGRYRARRRRPPGRRRGAAAPHRREPDQVPGP